MGRNRALLAAALLSSAALAGADRVDDYILRTMQEQHIPGCSLAVLRKGHIVKMRSYGLANVEQNVAATNDTVYEVGSVSKQFEATALMELSKEGKLDWDAPISKYVPDLPVTWQGVIVRQLMSHTSGLPDYTDSKAHEQHAADHVSQQDVIKAVADTPLEFKPGEKWNYCNTGSFLCGMALEKITATPYDAFLHNIFFGPLGMTSTRLNDGAKPTPNQAAGYVWTGKWGTPDVENSSWPFAGGGILSSIKDMARWEQELHRREVAHDPLLKEMWTPVQLQCSGSYPYGLGWQLLDDRGQPNIWHTGHIPGFSAVFSRFPSDGYTVILLTNEDSISTLGIARDVACLFDQKLLSMRSLKPTPDPDPEQTKRMFQGVSDFVSGKDSPDICAGFKATTTDAWKAQVLATTKMNLQFTFLGTDDVRSRKIERLGAQVARINHYQLSFADVRLNEAFYLTSDGKLAFIGDE